MNGMSTMAAAATLAVLLSPTLVGAQTTQTNVTLVSNFAYEDPQRGTVEVRIVYFGSPLEGVAAARYVYADGKILDDTMSDCALSDSNGAWTINCTNPHFKTWDGLGRGWYSVSSERVTGGKLMHFDLVGPVTVSARYDRGSRN